MDAVVSYLFSKAVRRNVEILGWQLMKLENTKEMVQGRIDAAQFKGEIIRPQVQEWLHRVEITTAEAQSLLLEYANASSWGLNYLRSRHRISKKAERCSLLIKGLQYEGRVFESVSAPAPKPESSWSSGIKIDAFQSLKSAKDDILEALVDQGIQIIGICGMGGVGKTTLAEEVCKQVTETKLFHEVAWVYVTQEVSITNIQEDIANMLGMALSESNQLQRARSLRDRINKGEKTLVILDDVWSKLDLDAIGIPFGNDHMNCKILLTSRSQHVCKDMGAQRIIHVQPLPAVEAWDLFRAVAGEAVDTDALEHIAKEIVRACGGLPLAIISVGRGLRNQSMEMWMDAAQKLKKGAGGELSSAVELRKEDAKACFLLCCLFPKDEDIPVESLVIYGRGLGFFDNVNSLKEARVRVHNAVDDLKASSLLLVKEDRRFVNMRDGIYDAAISQYDKIFLVEGGIKLKEWPERATFKDYTSISLIQNCIRELPVGLECPNLQTLLLHQSYSLATIPHDFFQGMIQLHVLDMRSVQISSLPRSLALLTTLRTLLLDYSNLQEISILGKLEKLEILSLRCSRIKVIPEQIGQLTNLMFFDIRGCHKLSRIAPGVLSRLCKLEELLVGDSFMHWEIEVEGKPKSNASLSELNLLFHLKHLDIFMPIANFVPKQPQFKLSRFDITIGSYDRASLDANEYQNCCSILTLTLDVTIPLLGWIKELIKAADCLSLISFKNLSNILKDLDLNSEGFDKLKLLELMSCHDLPCLVNTEDRASQLAFCSVEQLRIIKLENLIEICHGQLPDKLFRKLHTIRVSHCHQMLNIVQSNLQPVLQNLIEVTVSHCSSLAYVFESEGVVVREGETKPLSKLNNLHLKDLPKLKDIFSGPNLFVSFSSLQILMVEKCHELRRLFSQTLVQGLVDLEKLFVDSCNTLEEVFGTSKEGEFTTEIEVWNDDIGGSSYLQKLKDIKVEQCEKLRNLFYPSIAKCLAQLTTLMIYGCSTIEYIVGGEKSKEGEAPIEKIMFPCLKRITLDRLFSLKSFCSGNYMVEYPSLVKVKIFGCPKLETWGCGVQVTPKLRDLIMKNSRCAQMMSRTVMGLDEALDINDIVQENFKYKAADVEDSVGEDSGSEYTEDEDILHDAL